MLKFSEVREKAHEDPRVPELARVATILQRRFLLDLFKKTSAKRLSIPQYTLLGFLAAASWFLINAVVWVGSSIKLPDLFY